MECVREMPVFNPYVASSMLQVILCCNVLSLPISMYRVIATVTMFKLSISLLPILLYIGIKGNGMCLELDPDRKN